MHRQEPCLNGREGVPASVARIALQQASRGFGDLVDYGIFRDPSQESKPLQHLEPGPHLGSCGDQLLSLHRRTVAAQGDQQPQELLRDLIQTA